MPGAYTLPTLGSGMHEGQELGGHQRCQRATVGGTMSEAHSQPAAQFGLSGEGGTAPSTEASAVRDDRLISSDPRTRLSGWQARLSEHFGHLEAARRESGWPVFALEHGLDATEREALMGDVRECAGAGPGRDVPLPWVVYAAEIGYEYSGYEYWQTFESKTGLDKKWFKQISALFTSFAETYYGAVPEGAWARWFRHIAWPITHGILPRDLQWQLAALLYNASMSFHAETFSSAETLGHHLRLRCDGCSSRFRQFAENATLLGQIALALLLQQDAGELLEGGSGVLHTATLARIVDDLNRERDARHWLAEARSAARFRIRGLARIPLRSRATDTGQHGARTGEASDGPSALPRPRFVLRETAAGQWQVRLHLPNLGHLLGRFPRARDVLTRAQGRVGGPAGPLLARSRIVSESWPAVTLDAWPTPETPLLAFDGAPPELESVLRAGFRIDAGDRWIFLIGSDGQAREIATRVLRTGESYLILQRKETRNPVAGLGIQIIQVACAGVYGLRIDVPDKVPDSLIDVLGILGVKVAQTLEVWPVGLPAPDWSGDGYAEWVAGHPIVLGVRADRRIARLTLTLDGLRQTDISPVPDAPIGAPAFLQLPPLRPGLHRLAVVAHTADDAALEGRDAGRDEGASSGLQGQLEFAVREARAATAGQEGALSFVMYPSTPSLEDLWEDRIELHVAAPGAPSVRCRMVLRGLGGQELFSQSFTLPSPCDSDDWRRAFTSHRRGAEDLYDEAQVCTLEFDAGALGRARVVAERDFTALRWAVHGNGHRAVLIDSQGGPDLTVNTVHCAAPSLEQRGNVAEALEGMEIDDGGALLIARSSGLEAATVVVPQQRLTEFAALSGQRPHVPPGTREATTIVRLMRMATLWERARLTGSSLAALRRARAVEALVSRLVTIVAGERWANAEEVLGDRGEHAAADLMRGLVANQPDQRAVAVLLSDRLAIVAQSPLAEAEAALDAALRPFIHVPNLETLSPFALRLASSPLQAHEFVEGRMSVTENAAARERELIEGLLDCPVILRAARYFVIATRAVSARRGHDLPALPWRT